MYIDLGSPEPPNIGLINRFELSYGYDVLLQVASWVYIFSSDHPGIYRAMKHQLETRDSRIDDVATDVKAN